MSDYPFTRGSPFHDRYLKLRLAALAAVIAGVILVTAAAFLLSYDGIREIAFQAGVSPNLARLYPLMFDAMLIITGSAVLALRNGTSGKWSRVYAWTVLFLLVAAVAAGDAVHATGHILGSQAARAIIAIVPWILLLLGLGIWLAMLRQRRRIRAEATVNGHEASAANGAAGANGTAVSRAGQDTAVGTATAAGAVTWAAGRGAAGAPRTGIDALLERRAGRAPGRPAAAEGLAAGSRVIGQDQDDEEEHAVTLVPARRATPARAGTATAGAADKATGSAGSAGQAATGTGTAGAGSAATAAATGTTGKTGTGSAGTGLAEAGTGTIGAATTGKEGTGLAEAGTGTTVTGTTGTAGTSGTAGKAGTGSAGTAGPAGSGTGTGIASRKAGTTGGSGATGPGDATSAGDATGGDGTPGAGGTTATTPAAGQGGNGDASSAADPGTTGGPDVSTAVTAAADGDSVPGRDVRKDDTGLGSIPSFKRMRSTPTPPRDPEADR